MKSLAVFLLLIAATPLFASENRLRDGDVVLQVVERDFDRDGLADRATLVRNGTGHYVIVEKAGEPVEKGVRRIPVHPANFTNPVLVFNESARYLMLGQHDVEKKMWILWSRGEWRMLADGRSGIDHFVKH